MRALKKILIALGSVFVILIALFAWLGVQSLRFKHREAPFVQAYLADFSRHWNVADVYNRCTNEFLAQAGSANGQRAIQGFRALGTLTSLHDFELRNFTDGTWGRRGVFDFKADFERGEALVEVTLIDKGSGGARVLSINLSNIQMNSAATSKIST